jgi:hypothetical protein
MGKFVNLFPKFEPQYLLLIFSIYGLQQGEIFIVSYSDFCRGLCSSWLAVGRNYFLKDVLSFNSSQAQIFVALTWLPLNIKPLYGIISDTIRIYGYHRTPYLLLATACGCLCQLILALSASPSSSFAFSSTSVCLLLIGINLSIAMSDVIIDASITASVNRQNEQETLALQIFCSCSLTLCSMTGYLSSGLLIDTFGIYIIFLLSALVSFVIFLFTLFGFLNETSASFFSPSSTSSCPLPLLSCRMELYQRNPSIFSLALFICLIAIALTALMVLFQDNASIQLLLVFLSSLLLLTVPYLSLKPSSLQMAKLALLLFVCDALTPNFETVMFFWYTGTQPGPSFSSSQIGSMSLLGSCFMFFGVLLFHRYCSHSHIRTLLITSQVSSSPPLLSSPILMTSKQTLLSLFGLFDLFIVLKYQFPSLTSTSMIFQTSDSLLALCGDVIFVPFLRRFKILPLLVLSSRICPNGMEATLYAMFMSLINLGETIALYAGSLLMHFINTNSGLSDTGAQMILGIVLKTLLRLSLVPLVMYFIQDDSGLFVLFEKEREKKVR